jgi:hypothetical protein
VSYRRQWQEYKRRNRIFWSIFLTYLPGVALIGFLLSRLFGSDMVFLVLAISWMVAFLIAQTYLSNWKCPWEAIPPGPLVPQHTCEEVPALWVTEVGSTAIALQRR